MASLFPWDHLVWRQWQVHYSRIDTHHTNENTSIHLSRHTHTKIQSQKQGHKASAVSKITTDAHLYAALSRPPLYQILQQTCAAALWDGPQKNNNISYLFKQQPYTTLLLLYDLWLSFTKRNLRLMSPMFIIMGSMMSLYHSKKSLDHSQYTAMVSFNDDNDFSPTLIQQS